MNPMNSTAKFSQRAFYALTFLVISAGTVYAGQLGEMLVVDDRGKGLVTKIELVPPQGHEHAEYVGTTSQNGKLVMAPTLECPQRHRIAITVTQGRYFSVERDCGQVGNPHREVLTSWGVAANLYKSFQVAEASENFATAALISNEISARVGKMSLESWERIWEQALAAGNENGSSVAAMLDVEIKASKHEAPYASSWSAQTIALLGRSLNFENTIVYDPTQNQVVMTESFSQALKAYQSKQSLPETGVIDYLTLKRAAGEHIGRHIYSSPTNFQ